MAILQSRSTFTRCSLCWKLFFGMAYGMLMTSAGFAWYYPLLISLTVYTGAFQFVLVTLLSSTASILTIALTAVLIIYCLKDALWHVQTEMLPNAVAVLAVAVSYKWKHNTFLSILLGTAVYMVLLRIL